MKYDIRDDSVSDLILAYKVNLQKHKNGSLKKRPMDCYYKFRSKKDKSHVITIRSRDYNKGTSFINDMIKDGRVPKVVFYDLKL